MATTMETLHAALQATQQRLIELERTVARQTAEAVETSNKLEYLEAEREKLQRNLDASYRKGDGRSSIVDSKGLMRPNVFNGDRTKWRQWLSKLGNWMSGWHPRIRQVIIWTVLNQPEGVDINEADMFNLMNSTGLDVEEIARINTDLYAALTFRKVLSFGCPRLPPPPPPKTTTQTTKFT